MGSKHLVIGILFPLLSSVISLCSYKPDVIEGDMDSVRPEVKEHYSNLVSCFKLKTLYMDGINYNV